MDKQSINSEASETQQNLRWFSFSVIFSEILGVIIIILVAVWFGRFHEGFAWTSAPKKEFNYHPVLMVVGLIFLYANAIMVYRVFRNERKKRIKYLHGILHLLAFLFAVIALQAVFDSHNLADKPVANLYSMHSWLGITTVVLFCCQFVVGFVSFLIPGLRMNLRAAYLPIHVYFGLGIFLMAVATALTGIMEKAIFSLNDDYQKFLPEGVLVNCLGLCLLLFAFTVVYVVVNPNYKRRPLPEEELALIPSHQN